MVKWFARAIILTKQEKSKLRPNHWKRIREGKNGTNKKSTTEERRTTTNVLYLMLYSSMLDYVDDNDGRTVMMMTTTTSSTMKNNDVCTTYNDAIGTSPMAKAHKFSVSHRKTETKRYDTEIDCCFFPFLRSLDVVHCKRLLLLLSLLVSMVGFR